MFLFVGDLDPVNAKLTWFQPLIDRYRESGLTDVSWHVYGNARHEVLNEINRQEVVANLQAAIDRVTGTFASKGRFGASSASKGSSRTRKSFARRCPSWQFCRL